MVSHIYHEDYKCALCYDIYSQSKLPKILIDCGHTFCSVCLEKCCCKQPFFCPMCKKPQKLTKEGVATLPTVYNLLSIAEKAENSSEHGIKSKKQLCKKHQSPLESVCMDCDAGLCPKCMVKDLKRGKHKHHSIVTLTEYHESKKSEIKRQQDRVSKVYGQLLEHHSTKVNAFQKEIDSLKQKIDRDAHQAVDEINKNLHKCFSTLDMASEKAVGKLEKDIIKVHDEVDSFQEETSTLLSSAAERSILSIGSIRKQAEKIEAMVDAFDSRNLMDLPRLDLLRIGYTTLSDVDTEPQPLQHPRGTSKSSESSLSPTGSFESRIHELGLVDFECSEEYRDSTGASRSTDTHLYRGYATHGSFGVCEETGTIVHLCCSGGNSNDVCDLVQGMEPPPDALVWGWDLVAPPFTDTYTMTSSRWDDGVQGVRRAEETKKRRVAVAPMTTLYDPIRPLVDHVTSHRQNPAAHIIVVCWDESYMAKWQKQLEADVRLMPLDY